MVCSLGSVSQDFELSCGSDVIGWMNGGKAHWHPIVNCPCVEYPTANSIPDLIRDSNERYITDRLGAEFFKERVVFRGGVVVRPDKFDELKESQPWIDKDLCNDRIAFAFEYYFIVQDSMNFYFTTMFDEKGELASHHQIPDEDQIGMGSWISPCDAKAIADQDTRYVGLIENISFEFHEQCNCFVWKAQKPEIRKGRKITTPFALVDAGSGKLLDYVVEQGTIVCRMDSW